MGRLKIRPLKGWRAFIGEVGVIILGVLIALGLGTVAEDIGWSFETRAARKAIGLELGENVAQGLERARTYRCVEKRLDQLAILVDKSAEDSRLPPLGDIATPPLHSWTTGTWESVVNAQTATHFNREELGIYAAAYAYIEGLAATTGEERRAWIRLYPMVGPGRSLGPAEAAELIQAISEARTINRVMSRRGLLLGQMVEAYGLHIDDAYMGEILNKALSDYAICKPIPGNVPPQYGQAPQEYTLERVEQNPMRRIPL